MASFSSTSPPDEGPLRPVALPVANGNRAQETSSLRVFLVEDSASVRERLTDFLSEAGKVELTGFAETEADAVRELLAHPVDVAIVDLNLREGSGIGVIESVRARHTTAPPTIVVLTNYAFPEFESACLKRGADYFFDKSTQFGAVKALLESMRRRVN
jgi:DNA-binding NarL/FixJ family response regulator